MAKRERYTCRDAIVRIDPRDWYRRRIVPGIRCCLRLLATGGNGPVDVLITHRIPVLCRLRIVPWVWRCWLLTTSVDWPVKVLMHIDVMWRRLRIVPWVWCCVYCLLLAISGDRPIVVLVAHCEDDARLWICNWSWCMRRLRWIPEIDIETVVEGEVPVHVQSSAGWEQCKGDGVVWC